MRSESIRKEKRMRRNNILIGLALLFLMVFSMLAIYVDDSSSVNPDLVYNGYKFEIEDVNGVQRATTVINSQKYSFYTLPQDSILLIENITGISELNTAETIIFANEPLGLNSQASSEQLYFDIIVLDLQLGSGKRILSGISAQDEYSTKQVYTCSDASVTTPLVFLKKGTFQGIKMTQISPYCYMLESDSMSLLSFRDYLMYSSLGIISKA
ncbi:MAG: hypothetical protein WC758_00140 [Candidatus Woesearchaeota archaeon]|jgi:hypothetical protein